MVIGVDASRAAAGQRTGTEAYAYYLIQALIPLAQTRGHQLRLYFNRPPAANLFPHSAHVRPVIIPFPRLWTHLRLAWELRRRPPDLFFTPAHVIPFGFRGRGVATIHDLGYLHFPEAHTPGQLAYLRLATIHNAERGQRVIADSQATKEDLIRFHQIDPAKIEVVYPGLAPGLAQVTDRDKLAAVWQKYGITPPYFLYLGTLQPRKNLVRLVQAYAAYAETLPPDERPQLVLAGKAGWLSDPILAEVWKRALPIVITGFVDEENKPALLSGAIALLFPSLYEGFGFPVLEAQACGTAVLCSNSSSLPEVAGEAALLVDPHDMSALAAAIQRMAKDETLRAELVAKGFANIKRFTWEETAGRVLAVLEGVANE
jgi:glycosyltransferase involved in cell wall biosynthesis